MALVEHDALFALSEFYVSETYTLDIATSPYKDHKRNIEQISPLLSCVPSLVQSIPFCHCAPSQSWHRTTDYLVLWTIPKWGKIWGIPSPRTPLSQPPPITKEILDVLLQN